MGKSTISMAKHTKNYGKSPFLMGKSTISMAISNSYVKLPEGMFWAPTFQKLKKASLTENGRVYLQWFLSSFASFLP